MSYVHPVFFDILQKAGFPPAGHYRLYLSLQPENGTAINTMVLLQADSVLPAMNTLNRTIERALQPSSHQSWWTPISNVATRSFVPAARTIDQQSGKIARAVRLKGLSQKITQQGNRTFINLYYERWFVRRYELDGSRSAARQIEERRQRLTNNLSSGANTELESYQSLFSQLRELSKAEKEDRELGGDLSLTGNWSNGQPEYSAQDNNYYELRGRVETELSNIPVSVEGYYTTQDAHRQVKGSFIRFHYDASRAKDKLAKLISGYRNKYEETMAKGKGLEQVYNTYLSSLELQKNQAIYSLKNEVGLEGYTLGKLDTAGLRSAIEASLASRMHDSAVRENKAGMVAKEASAKAARLKDSADRLYTLAIKRYGQVKATEQQIDKYSKLLEQYRNTAYFDSALSYSKVQTLKGGDEVSYKQMAKSASAMLPEGNAKRFVAGLTKLDAGMINQYRSKYTAAGQQLKGLDFGYDLGIAELNIAVGKSEYAGRDGTTDKYSTYTTSLKFRPAKGQQASLIYYGYTPSKSVTGDNIFFKSTELSLPSFRSPVHILSATYAGSIAKGVQIEAEAATSYRNGSGELLKGVFGADRLAWHINAEGKVPATPITLIGAYEHGGKLFQNSTLPVAINGTDLYKAGVKGTFWGDFLTAKVELNHMEQQRLSGSGGNNRWGFEVATHSRQYPSISLGYKPFSTFRTIADTMAVPQRPLQGSVWTGRASYQIKRKGGVSYRFSAVYNKSTSHNDSLNYGSDLLQINAAFQEKRWIGAIAVGQSKLQSSSVGLSDSTLAAHTRTTFFNVNGGRDFKSGISLSAGAEFGLAPYGLSRYGLNAGMQYRVKQVPLSVRAYVRYGAYKLPAYSGSIRTDMIAGPETQPMDWRHLAAGSVELIWRFKVKINER